MYVKWSLWKPIALYKAITAASTAISAFTYHLSGNVKNDNNVRELHVLYTLHMILAELSTPFNRDCFYVMWETMSLNGITISLPYNRLHSIDITTN